MADGSLKQCFVGELLELELPESKMRTVTSAAVRSNQELLRLGVQAPALMAPPAANRRHSEGPGVVIGPHVDEALVSTDVVDAIRIRPRHVRIREVVAIHRPGMFRRKPLLAAVLVFPDQFLLLRVHRDDGYCGGQGGSHFGVDVTELGVPVRVIPALLSLPVALQAIVLLPKQLADLHMTDRVVGPAQLHGQGTGTLACPAQRGLWVTPGFRSHQAVEGIQ